MKIIRDGSLVQIGDRFRIEPGPVLKREIATLELLDDSKTAPHYKAPELVDYGDGTGGLIVTLDALAQPIEVGKEMAYLDWVAFNSPDSIQAFYAYERQERTPAELADSTETHIWREVGQFPSEDDAMAFVISKIGA